MNPQSRGGSPSPLSGVLDAPKAGDESRLRMRSAQTADATGATSNRFVVKAPTESGMLAQGSEESTDNITADATLFEPMVSTLATGATMPLPLGGRTILGDLRRASCRASRLQRKCWCCKRGRRLFSRDNEARPRHSRSTRHSETKTKAHELAICRRLREILR